MYTPLALHDLDGNFIAYTICKTDEQGRLLKLHTTNVWAYEDSQDLTDQIQRLNDEGSILAFWPDARDPEVRALTDDPTWEPLSKHPVEVPDDEKSVYVYTDPPREEDGFPGAIDEDASVIVMKTVLAPSPTDNLRRVKSACEIVARRRAEAYANGNQTS